MPSPLFVHLSHKEDQLLLKLSQTSVVPVRTRNRAIALRLSARKWRVAQIAEYLSWHQKTVRETIHRWQRGGFSALWDDLRGGRKRQWQPLDLEYIEEKLSEPRTYNTHQLAELLKKHRQVSLGPTRIRDLLKQRKYLWKRTRHSQKRKQNQKKKSYKQADFEMLQLAAACRLMRIKYLDESGFSGWTPVSYTWAKKGEQKHIEQTKRCPRRISILGIFQPGVSFEYGLAVGGIRSNTFITMMELQAEKAAQWWQETGEVTVIVLDNYSIHKSKQVKAKIPQWSQKHLYLFYLPEYCCEWNRIEDEWHQIKAHEMSGKMFDDEYELVQAVIAAIDQRSASHGYTAERFKFNSTTFVG